MRENRKGRKLYLKCDDMDLNQSKKNIIQRSTETTGSYLTLLLRVTGYKLRLFINCTVISTLYSQFVDIADTSGDF